MQANQWFIYLFRVKATQEVIYVGSCKHFANRLNEHRRAFREERRALPIHRYMKENDLQLFRDVEIAIVEYWSDTTKEHALEVEAEYYHRYKATIKNTRPAEIRTGIYATRNKAVRCVTDGKVFYSMRKAAEYYGINRATIAAHINKGRKLKNNLLFEYVDGSNKADIKNYAVVRCVDDDKYFQWFTECAKYYGIPVDRLMHYRRHGKKRFIVDGRTFERCND